MEKNNLACGKTMSFQRWKIFLIMKLLAVFILGLVLQSYAVDVKGQNKRLNLDFENVTLKEVLQKLQDQSDYSIIYKDDLITSVENITASFRDEKVTDLLEKILQNTNLTFAIEGKTIVIVQRKIESVAEQQKSVIGKVTDQSGMPLTGVSVVIKGTTTGYITDNSGNFSIPNISENTILQFSFLGMKGQEIIIGSNTKLDVVLTEETIGIQEVVAVGYGTQVKRDVTGAMTAIKATRLKEYNVSSVSEALVGMVAGVQVNQISGIPGTPTSIRIRGVGSITAGNEPLYIIDGFPMGDDALSNFNMNNIESINILKDASATAIYGSRGANGVILITTKKGQTGSPKVTLEMYYGFQKVTKKVDVLSPEEFVEFTTDAVNNAWEYLGHDPNDDMSTRPVFYQNPPYYYQTEDWVITDWQDEIFQTSPILNTQLSVNGGSQSIRYNVNGSFFDQNGIVKNSDFKRSTLGVNLDINITKKLKFSTVINASKVGNDKVADTGQWNSGIVGTALSLPGFFAANQNEDGSYQSMQGLGYSVSTVYNPMVFINEYSEKEDKSRILGNVSLEYEIIKGLNFKTLYGFDNYNIRDNYFQKGFNYDVPTATNYVKGNVKANGKFNESATYNWVWENTLNYNTKLNNIHSLNALIGMTAQKAETGTSAINATNFPDNSVPTLNAGQVSSASTTLSEWSLLSYLARINYALLDKYYLALSIRADGSSRFGEQNQWGYFPSVSLGWIASEEKFLKNSSWVNFLKLRLSYGYSGNNAIPNYGSIGLLSYSSYVLGGKIISGIVPSTLSNANLGWELSKQFNIGVELGCWKDRIKLIVDGYNTISDNLLLNVPVPSILGVTNSLRNIGKVRNRGIEISLVTQNITGKFGWSTDFNISFNRNKVLELGPSGTAIRSTSNQESNITQVGRPIGDFYGYIFDGVYNSQEEIDQHPHLSTDRTGDPIVRDVNGDKQITVDDRTVLGNYQPDFFYGLGNTFKYKGFDLAVFIQGVSGSEIMNLGMRQTASMTGRTNSLGLARDRWRSPTETGNGKVFKASIDVYGVRRDPSSFYMEDGSYLRIRNITFGYNFNPSLVKKILATSARIYISSQNPFTWTKYSGYNPEISSYNSSLTPGIDYFAYPLSKNLIMGINVTF
jgi:TonB-linked SusC/RagA family outer membrane protein